MNRTKKFAINSASSAFLQILTLIVGLILPRVILEIYGSEANGLVNSIVQFIGYLLLLEAGLSGAAIYVLYKPLAEDDFSKINTIMSTAKSSFRTVGIVFISILFVLMIIYPNIVEYDGLSKVEISFLVFVIGLKGVFNFLFMAKYRTILIADQKVYAASFSAVIYLLSSTILILSFILNGFSIVIAYSTTIVALILQTILLSRYVKHKYTHLNFSTPVDITLLKQRWDVLYLQILGTIQRGMPIILLTLFDTLKTVSIFTIYNLVTIGLNGILSIFISGLFPSFGNVITKNQLDVLQKSYSEFECAYYCLITWVFSCAIILIVPFVQIYTDGIVDANYTQPVFALLIVINAFLHNLKIPQGMLVISAGLYKETRWQTTIQGVIALVISAILISPLSLKGVMIGMIASNIYRSIDLFFFIPKYVTKLPPMHTLFRVARNIIIMLAAIIYNYKYPIQISSIYEWCGFAVFISIIVAIIVFLINGVFEKNTFINLFYRMRLVLSNKS